MSSDPVVVGVGVMTAVGLSTAETAAAVRATTMRFTETPLRDHRFEPFTLAEVPPEGLPPLNEALEKAQGLTSREARLLRLAAAPIAESLSALPGGEPPPPLIMALPEARTNRPLDPAAFLDRLRVQCENRFDAARSIASYGGRAGGLVAIGHAAQAIRSGQVQFMLAGGVDTYRDLYVLGTLDMEKRVKSTTHLDGFIPGEGAAFLLLASSAAATTANLKPLARVSGLTQGFEAGHLYSEQPYRGDGLATAVTQLVNSGALPSQIAEVWSSMNGEYHWSKEWGVAFLRNKSAFTDPHGIHHPADCFGDTGAACGPTMVALQALGMRGQYRRAPALIYGSSDYGQRAVLSLVSPG